MSGHYNYDITDDDDGTYIYENIQFDDYSKHSHDLKSVCPILSLITIM